MTAPETVSTPSAQLLTVDELADRLRTTPAAVYSSRYRGQEPAALGMKSGRRLLFNWHEVVKWLESTRDPHVPR